MEVNIEALRPILADKEFTPDEKIDAVKNLIGSWCDEWKESANKLNNIKPMNSYSAAVLAVCEDLEKKLLINTEVSV